MSDSINDVVFDTTAETKPDVSLMDFYEAPSGAWPKGWYAAEIVEGYTTGKGTQFETAEMASKTGDSRNLRICYLLHGQNDKTRNVQASYNYRPSDFTPERISYVKEMREEFKGVRGRWSNSDAQRSSLALVNLSQLEKALGKPIKRNDAGHIMGGQFINQKVDVYLNIDDQGYNVVKNVEPTGTRTKKVS